MNEITKIRKYITDRNYRFIVNARRGMYNHVPDKEFIERMFFAKMGYKLDLENPTTYNEKLQWLKLYDRQPYYTTMVDKYEAKKYVSERIGDSYIIPTYGVWDSFEDIDFNMLPDRFVLKCTHDCGGLVICKDKKKLDIKKAREKIEKSLKRNYYYIAREWPYKNVKHRIIAEEYIESISEEGAALPVLKDYKLHCFNGKFDCVFICEGRFSERGVRYHYFDREWQYLPYCTYLDTDIKELTKNKPAGFAEMIRIAEKLSSGIPQVRVDLYDVNGRVFFGELTFFSQMGFDTTITREADLILGNKLRLPNVTTNSDGEHHANGTKSEAET